MQFIKGQRKYAVVLALIAAAILALGMLFKPAAPANEKNPTLELSTIEDQMERLQEAARRNSLRNTGTRFAAMANEAASHLVRVSPLNHTGIVWGGEGSVLVPRDPDRLPQTLSLESEAERVAGTPSFWSAGLPFAVVKGAVGRGAPPQIVPAEQLVSGAWVLLVTIGANQNVLFSPGIYSGTSSLNCGGIPLPRLETNLPLDQSSVGGGLFDLDGNLVGIVVRCESSIAAIPAEAAQRALDSLNNPAAKALAGLGLQVTNITEQWKPFVKTGSGALVTDVWANWPAAEGGIRPADVILAVNQQLVSSAEDLQNLLSKTPAATFLLQRGQARLTVTIAPHSGDVAVTMKIPDSGITLSRVDSGSSAARAGLQEGDRLLSLNGTIPDELTATRALGAFQVSAPVLVVAQRGARMFATVVTP